MLCRVWSLLYRVSYLPSFLMVLLERFLSLSKGRHFRKSRFLHHKQATDEEQFTWRRNEPAVLHTSVHPFKTQGTQAIRKNPWNKKIVRNLSNEIKCLDNVYTVLFIFGAISFHSIVSIGVFLFGMLYHREPALIFFMTYVKFISFDSILLWKGLENRYWKSKIIIENTIEKGFGMIFFIKAREAPVSGFPVVARRLLKARQRMKERRNVL